jgi:histidyl-tRNA synthetase
MQFQPPKGTRDFLPEDMIARKFILETIEKTFQKFGFQPMDTPAFEDWQLLSKKGSGGEAIKNEIYYFRDKSDRELGLRFDLTVPTARVVASNPQLPKPFKRYQIGKVWRYDNPQAGRFREFTQTDADIFGSKKMACEAECMAAAVYALKQLGFRDFSIRLNNRKILNALLEFTGIKNPAEVLRVLDKLEKTGENEVLRQLTNIAGEKTAKKLLSLIKISGQPKTVLLKGRKVLGGIKTAEEGFFELEEITKESETYGISGRLSIDFSLVRGLDYYTGPIYEISAKSAAIGSIAGGGRYDSLIGLYSGKPIPATGFSFGVERICEIMKNEGMFKFQKTYTKIFVVSVSDKTRKDAMEIAEKLRSRGIETETDLMGRDIRKQMEYANSTGIPFALFVGEKELKEKKFTLKDMRTGKEKKIKIEEIITCVLKSNSQHC